MTLAIHTLTANPALDLATEADSVVEGDKIRCGPPRYDPGGGGVNVSRVIHRLGGNTLAHLAVGGDSGHHVLRLLHEEAVPVAAVSITGDTRQSVTVHAKDTGGEYRFILPGPVLTAGEQRDLSDSLTAAVKPGDMVVLSGSLPPGVPATFYAEIARQMKTLQVKVAVDCSGDALAGALSEGVWLVKPSRRELHEYVGHPLTDTADVLVAAKQLVAAGASDIVAVSLGAEGAALVTAEGAWLATAPVIVQKSAVGAGDSFLAQLVLAMVDQQPLAMALAAAVAAGAATAETSGTALCQRDEISRLQTSVQVTSLEQW